MGIRKPRCKAKEAGECFDCPHPECVAGYSEIRSQESYRAEKEGRKRKKPEQKAKKGEKNGNIKD